MSTSIVSIRMPASLISGLKELARKKHFMDLSEEVRFIIKQKMLEQKDPFSHEIAQLKEEIKAEISRTGKSDRLRMIEELRKLLEEIKSNDGEDKGKNE